jgi:hypothetical protein
VDAAIEWESKGIELAQHTLGILPNHYQSDLGQCYYVKLDFENAQKAFEQVVFKTDMFDGKGKKIS